MLSECQNRIYFRGLEPDPYYGNYIGFGQSLRANSKCIGSKYRLPALLYTGVADFYGHIMPMVYGHLLFPSLRIYLPVWRGSTYIQRHKENFSQGGGKYQMWPNIENVFKVQGGGEQFLVF